MSKFITSPTSSSNFICASSMPKYIYIYIYIYIKVLVVTKYDHASTVLQELNNNNVRVIITNETNKIISLHTANL